MIEKPLYTAGDSVEVLLRSYGWVEATVVRSFPWSDGHGNTYTSYEVDIGTGRICCGPNSLRALLEPSRAPQA